jgi:hypothetical protein
VQRIEINAASANQPTLKEGPLQVLAWQYQLSRKIDNFKKWHIQPILILDYRDSARDRLLAAHDIQLNRPR